ncbi:MULTISPECIES: NUDIX hydrolase [Streptomyces]|uniref:NUDIX hydrolase n=1 Tax=Streptomyces TaxID=1883 RepID=UPI001B33256E|nr:NUDIX hydrolase [Streptomyces sp. AgN23]QTI90612.1 NUDIX hydrolase [Streptomyces sp. AgN23]WTA78562.1 NUDIX hydrolase [Streptomyces antimycoticus]WTA86838.1 NUDIX hydrolase [Streptomyces antimycoticus]
MNYVMDLRKLVGSRPLLLPGTSVLITDDQGRLLLVERVDTGDWGLPGGLMEPGESFEETGMREVREETGLDIHDLQLFGVYSGADYYYRYPHGDEIYNVTAAYTARVAGGRLAADGAETKRLHFFPLDELPKDILAPELPIVEAFLHRTGPAAGRDPGSGQP